MTCIARYAQVDTRERKSSVYSKHVDITRVIVVDGELKTTVKIIFKVYEKGGGLSSIFSS